MVAFALLVSSCGGASQSAEPSQLGNDISNPLAPNPSTISSNVTFRGQLPLGDEISVDISQMLAEENYGNPLLEGVARDGSNLLVKAESNYTDSTGNRKHGYLRIDTTTGNASWLHTNINPSTGILFDENNMAILVASVNCLDLTLIDHTNDSPINFNNLIPTDRCLARFVLSRNGNVVVYQTVNREPLVDGMLNYEDKIFAYHLNSASLSQYPDTSIVIEGDTVTPDIPMFSNRSYPLLSNDGIHVFARQWWGLNADVNTGLNRIGIVVWNTLANTWTTRALAHGDKTWCRNGLDRCTQPFNYAVSADGRVLYAQIPNGEIVDSNKYGYYDGSTVSRSQKDSINDKEINGLVNVLSLNSSHDGQLLSFYANELSNDLTEGLNLYNNSTEELIPIEPAISSCSNEVNEFDCDANAINGTRNTYFSEDSSHLFITAPVFPTHSAEYTLDLLSGSLYLLPSKFSAFQGMVSEDASVFVTQSTESENIFYIAKRQL